MWITNKASRFKGESKRPQCLVLCPPIHSQFKPEYQDRQVCNEKLNNEQRGWLIMVCSHMSICMLTVWNSHMNTQVLVLYVAYLHSMHEDLSTSLTWVPRYTHGLLWINTWKYSYNVYLYLNILLFSLFTVFGRIFSLFKSIYAQMFRNTHYLLSGSTYGHQTPRQVNQLAIPPTWLF